MNNKIDKDYYGWLVEAAGLIKKDIPDNEYKDDLIDLVLEMAKKEEHAAASAIKVLLHHMLKWKYQPSHQTVSWETSMLNAMHDFEDTISPAMWRNVLGMLDREYTRARALAHKETGLPLTTFPVKCEWGYKDIIQWKNPNKPGNDPVWPFVERFVETYRAK